MHCLLKIFAKQNTELTSREREVNFLRSFLSNKVTHLADLHSKAGHKTEYLSMESSPGVHSVGAIPAAAFLPGPLLPEV